MSLEEWQLYTNGDGEGKGRREVGDILQVQYLLSETVHMLHDDGGSLKFSDHSPPSLHSPRYQYMTFNTSSSLHLLTYPPHAQPPSSLPTPRTHYHPHPFPPTPTHYHPHPYPPHTLTTTLTPPTPPHHSQGSTSSTNIREMELNPVYASYTYPLNPGQS